MVLYSACGDKVIPGIVAYYSVIISFLLYTGFCIYSVIQLKLFHIRLVIVEHVIDLIVHFSFKKIFEEILKKFLKE